MACLLSRSALRASGEDEGCSREDRKKEPFGGGPPKRQQPLPLRITGSNPACRQPQRRASSSPTDSPLSLNHTHLLAHPCPQIACPCCFQEPKKKNRDGEGGPRIQGEGDGAHQSRKERGWWWVVFFPPEGGKIAVPSPPPAKARDGIQRGGNERCRLSFPPLPPSLHTHTDTHTCLACTAPTLECHRAKPVKETWL